MKEYKEPEIRENQHGVKIRYGPTIWEQRVNDMLPGEELDALVHEKVMGIPITCSLGIKCVDIPSYSDSDSMDSAFLLVKKLKQDSPGACFWLEYEPMQLWPNEDKTKPTEKKWKATTGISGTDMCYTQVYAHEPALAICRLFLIAFVKDE